MGKYEKLLMQILQGSKDSNISFDDLCGLMKKLGFQERIGGSHHIFRKAKRRDGKNQPSARRQ
jgi:hypothetical protein